MNVRQMVIIFMMGQDGPFIMTNPLNHKNLRSISRRMEFSPTTFGGSGCLPAGWPIFTRNHTHAHFSDRSLVALLQNSFKKKSLRNLRS
jgi:hypothetical protein